MDWVKDEYVIDASGWDKTNRVILVKDTATPIIRFYSYTTCTWDDADAGAVSFEVAEHFYLDGEDVDITLSTYTDSASITALIVDKVPFSHASDSSRRL